MREHTFQDKSWMVLEEDVVAVYDPAGNMLLEGDVHIDEPEDEAFMFCAAHFYDAGESHKQFKAAGDVWVFNIPSLMDLSYLRRDPFLEWAADHLDELSDLRSGFLSSVE